MSKMPVIRSTLVIFTVLSGLCVLIVQTQPTNNQENGKKWQKSTEEPESLPPDTFRKLAQALYHRGDKEANIMERKFLYNNSIQCNDGSVAGYYIRRNHDSKRWIIFLEGKKKQRQEQSYSKNCGISFSFNDSRT